jgi:hypothetical protein
MWTEVSKAEDLGYGPPRKRGMSTGTGVAVVGGGALTALGARNIRDSRVVPEQATARANAAATTHAVNVGRQKRALSEAAHQEVLRESSRRGLKWRRSGKLRRARTNLELTSREADRSQAALAQHHNARSPAQLANRTKHLGRGGKVMVGTGITAITSPLWSRPFQKSDDNFGWLPPVARAQYEHNTSGKKRKKVKGEAGAARERFLEMKRKQPRGEWRKFTPEQSDALRSHLNQNAVRIPLYEDEVRKTITQARYGSNAEMGRAWRGPEKKDRKARDVAAAGLGVSGVGGGAALAAHRNRPAQMADRTTELKAIRGSATSEYQRVRAVQQGHGADFQRAKLLSGTGDIKGLHGLRAKHGISPTEMPIGQKRRIVAGNERRTTGMRGGKLIGHIQEKYKAATKEAAEHGKKVAAAHEAVTRHPGELAANASRRAKYTRIKGAGLGLAAIGGATALGAGIKAEKDRRTGLGKPRRTR